MSFILDALKKSESERKRQDAPGIANIPDAGRRAPPARWPWVVAGLLTINLIVLTVVVLRPQAPVPAERTAAIATPAPTSVRQPMPAASSRMREAPAEVAVNNSNAPVSQSPQAPVETRFEAPAAPPTITEGLPTLHELVAAGQMQLPDMHLDIHVYSGQPDDRFVFVNMTKYKEGATLTEGPSITEITQDGVVLDYFGTRFLLPRE